MTIGISRGRTEKAQKVVVYGPEGIGKTTLAAGFPDPLFIDVEDGTSHYDVARVDPAPASWQALMETVRAVAAERPCSTLVLDTADWAEGMCMRHLCAENRWKSIESPGYGKGYTALAEEFGRLLDVLSDVAEAGVNIVICAHAQMRKFEQPDEAAAYDRWELKLQKKVAPMVKEWADAVLFLNWKTTVEVVGEGKGAKGKARNARRTMFCQHHACWDAKNRWGLPEEVPAAYGSIAAFVPALRAASPAPATAPAARPAPATEAPPAAAAKPALPAFWAPALQLMAGIGASREEIRDVAVGKGHFTPDTPLENYPKEYVDGCIVAQWPAWKDAIEGLRIDREPVPFE